MPLFLNMVFGLFIISASVTILIAMVLNEWDIAKKNTGSDDNYAH